MEGSWAGASRDAAVGAGALLMWFLCNALTLIMNKWLFTTYAFLFPITLTAVHMTACTVLSGLLVLTGFTVRKTIPGGFRMLLAISLLLSFNIVLGNASLQYIPVSFMQAVKSSVPAITVFLQATAFGEAFSTTIYISLIPVVLGVAMASAAELNFNMLGFLLAVAASFTTALQTCLFSKHLKDLDPINFLFNLAPFAFLELIVLANYMEGPALLDYWNAPVDDDDDKAVSLVVFLIASGVVAFLLNLSTFFAIQCTSPLTFNVAGNFKAVINIVASCMVFHNRISLISGLGCAIAIAGVAWYGQVKSAA